MISMNHYLTTFSQRKRLRGLLQTSAKYLAFQVLRPLASDEALLGVAAILAVAAISSAGITRGLDGVLVASALGTIVSILNIIILKRLSRRRLRKSSSRKKKRIAR